MHLSLPKYLNLKKKLKAKISFVIGHGDIPLGVELNTLKLNCLAHASAKILIAFLTRKGRGLNGINHLVCN